MTNAWSFLNLNYIISAINKQLFILRKYTIIMKDDKIIHIFESKNISVHYIRKKQFKLYTFCELNYMDYKSTSSLK